MTALIIIGSILLFFALLIFVPLTATLVYDDEFKAFARVLFVRIKLFPRKKKKKRGPHSMSRRKAAKILASLEKKKQKKKAKKLKKQAKKEEKKAQEEKEGKKSFSEILDTVTSITSLATDALGRFGKRFHVRIAVMRITVATPDAAQTAIAYGAIQAALSQLYATLGQTKNFKLPRESKFRLDTDFSKTEPSAEIKIHFSFSIFALLAAAIGAVLKMLIRKAKEKAYVKARRAALEKKMAQRKARLQAQKAAQNTEDHDRSNQS